jgi:hypothetical protein
MRYFEMWEYRRALAGSRIVRMPNQNGQKLPFENIEWAEEGMMGLESLWLLTSGRRGMEPR